MARVMNVLFMGAVAVNAVDRTRGHMHMSLEQDAEPPSTDDIAKKYADVAAASGKVAEAVQASKVAAHVNADTESTSKKMTSDAHNMVATVNAQAQEKKSKVKVKAEVVPCPPVVPVVPVVSKDSEFEKKADAKVEKLKKVADTANNAPVTPAPTRFAQAKAEAKAVEIAKLKVEKRNKVAKQACDQKFAALDKKDHMALNSLADSSDIARISAQLHKENDRRIVLKAKISDASKMFNFAKESAQIVKMQTEDHAHLAATAAKHLKDERDSAREAANKAFVMKIKAAEAMKSIVAPEEAVAKEAAVKLEAAIVASAKADAEAVAAKKVAR